MQYYIGHNRGFPREIPWPHMFTLLIQKLIMHLGCIILITAAFLTNQSEGEHCEHYTVNKMH